MPGPEDMMGLLQQMLFGVGRYYQLPEIMDHARSLNPRERGQFMRGQLMKALARHPQSLQFLRSQVTSNDIGPIDWGEHQGTLGIGSMLGLIAHIAAISDIEGYTNFEQVRSIVSPIPPDNIAAIPYVGLKDMEVRLDGEFARRKFDFSLADVMGRVAYKPEMARQLREADTAGRHATKYAHLIDDIVEDDLGIPRGSLNFNKSVRWGEYQTYNGYRIESTGQLEDFLAPLAYAAEAFFHITNDTLEYTQTAKGSHREFHARKMHGARYFLEYALMDAQMAPEMNLTAIYPGGISKYAKDGLGYLMEGFGERGSPRYEALKDIFLYRPREGEADLVLATAIQQQRGRTSAAEMEAAVAEQAFIPVDHMRPVELWEARAARHVNLFAGVDFIHLHAAVSQELQQVKTNFATLPLEKQLEIYHIIILEKILGHVASLPAGQNSGAEGFRNLIKFAAGKGIAIFDWSKIGSRDFDNWVRYAGKVLDTAEVMQSVSKTLESMGAQLSEALRKTFKKPGEQLAMIGQRALEFGKQSMQFLGQAYGEGKFFAFTEDQQSLPFTYFWLRGFTRMHCVGRLDNQVDRFLMFDKKRFVDSNGFKVVPEGMDREKIIREWFTDLQGNVQQAEFQQFERELQRSGCWWVKDEAGEFLVGSSGRPLFYTATTRELYDRAGEAINEILQKQDVIGDERKRVLRMKETYDAIQGKGHNRFSMLWLRGRTPFGAYYLKEVFEKAEDNKLIESDQKSVLEEYVNELTQRGLIGASRDNDLCLAPPQSFVPSQYKVEPAVLR